jgi:hypothetical protein
MFDFLKKILKSARPPHRTLEEKGGFELSELTRRLGVTEQELRDVEIKYERFLIPKLTGGKREVFAPAPPLKAMQRRILRRLLARLKVHPCATGFERGHSIVTNALPHVGQDVVIRLDIVNFFTNTGVDRVRRFFIDLGWGVNAVALLTDLCTYEKGLPQGAPTSPRLSNLLNFGMDQRLAAMAQKRGLAYSRYADDITLSGSVGMANSGRAQNPKTLGAVESSTNNRFNDVIHLTRQIVLEEGYELHEEKKLRIYRRHERQLVTGLVVNSRVNLRRSMRRRLRAIEHRLNTTGNASMTPQQLQGWRALQRMIEAQSSESSE